MNSLRSYSVYDPDWKKNYPGWTYTILNESIRSWLKVYDPGWKYTILAEYLRYWLKVYDHWWNVYDHLRKISFTINIRSFIWKYTTLRAQWWLMNESVGSYTFSSTIVYMRRQVRIASTWKDRILSVNKMIVTFSSRIAYCQTDSFSHDRTCGSLKIDQKWPSRLQ